MNKTLFNTLVNLAMIETVIGLTSANIAWQVPVNGSTGLMVFAALFLFAGLVSLIPATLISFLVAYAVQGK